MQGCKVIVPERQSRSHILLYNFGISSIEDATKDKYGDLVPVGKKNEGPHNPRQLTTATLFSTCQDIPGTGFIFAIVVDWRVSLQMGDLLVH